MKPTPILLVSNYYPPERGAAPNRIQVLANALHRKGYKVAVVCPMPNYPTGKVFAEFKGKLYAKTIENGITIHRLWLWPSKSSNKFLRLCSMLSFSFSLKWFFILKRIPKLVFVQYSPVFVGFTAVLWGRLLRKKTVLNVSDLWPLAGLEMGLLRKGFYYSILEAMERFCYRSSQLILGQSEEILSHIASKKLKTPILLYQNFPAFTPPTLAAQQTKLPIKIVYAGLLGVAQGISEIVSTINFPAHVEFHIYGDGPEANLLAHPKNLQVIYHGTVARDILHSELATYDIAFIPLAKRIYGSVPSKIFEYARLGLPLLYMGGGEGGTIVSETGLGWVLPVQDYLGLQQFIDDITQDEIQKFPKKLVQERAVASFNFEAQFNSFLRAIDSI